MPTQKFDAPVVACLDAIEDDAKRADAETIIEMMSRHTGEPPELWNSGVIGFGRVKYRYPSGRRGETFITGFAPRKARITLHALWYPDENDPLLAKLGKHTHGKGCLYIKRISDVDKDVLEQIIYRSATDLSGRYIVSD